MLRKEFSVGGPRIEPGPAGYRPGGQQKWKEEAGPSDLRKWKSGKTPNTSEKTLELKKRLETEGLIKPKQYQGEQGGYQGRGGTNQQWIQPKQRQESKSNPESFEAGRKVITREQQQQRQQEQLQQQQQQQRQQKQVQQQQQRQQQQQQQEKQKQSYRKSGQRGTASEQQKVTQEQQKAKQEQQNAKEKERQNLEQQQKEKRKGPR